MADVEQRLTDEQIEAFAEIAKLDDWHTHMVGSDVRQIIGDLQRARRALPTPPSSKGTNNGR